MSKKTIVLADNSYTIRRIVELSFSEEEDIELVSFENSTNLREKLLELRPAIVLVDIKLPEFNGYEVCRFVNNTESLKNTRVFLLKGGFEPVDESLLKGLRFVDIITKPFDSNALVSTIKNLLREIDAGATAAPPSEMPDYLAEVDNLVEADEEINFSDVKEEISPGNVMTASSAGPFKGPSVYPDDEVLPSEEITQAQSTPDTLAPVFTSAEDIDNPFQEEEMPRPKDAGGLYEEDQGIKSNIEFEEQELDVSPHGETRKMDMFQEKLTGDEFQVSEDEMSAVDDMFSFDTGKKDKKRPVQGIPDLRSDEVEREMDLAQAGEIPDAEAIKLEEEMYQPPSPFTEEPEPTALSFEEEMSYGQPEPAEPLEMEIPGERETPVKGTSGYVDFNNESELEMETYPPAMEYEIPSPPSPPSRKQPASPPPAQTRRPTASQPQPPTPPQQAFQPTQAEPVRPPRQTGRPTPSAPPPQQSTPLRSRQPMQAPTPSAQPAPPVQPPHMQPTQPTKPMQPKQTARPTAAPPPPTSQRPSMPPKTPPTPPTPPTPQAQRQPDETAKPYSKPEKGPGLDNEKILTNVEDKLTTAVKEMLWEIMPPLAEKIIKEEIEKIKTDVSKTLK